MKELIEPYFYKYDEDSWEISQPEEIYSEKIAEVFWDAVEYLDYDPLYSENIFKSLIKKIPLFIDAFNHLSIAFKNQKKDFESFLTAEKAYNIAKGLIPKEFNKRTDKIRWICLPNRPFLRAFHIYGLELQEKKEYEKAISIYTDILRFNESDNQGIRYLVLECLFNLKDYRRAEKLINQYDGDWSIEFAYGKLSIEILKGNQNVSELLSNAIKINKFFPDEVIKTRHKAPPPHRIPGEPHFDAGIPIGSVQQAYDYWERNKSVYKQKMVIDYFTIINSTSA